MSTELPLSVSKLSTHGLTAYSSSPVAESKKSLPSETYIDKDGHPDVCFPCASDEFTLTFSQYLRLILTSRVYDIITETPVTPAVNLTSKLGVKVLLKREDLQPVFSFKVRGAYNKMAHLSNEDRWRGVIACSAG